MHLCQDLFVTYTFKNKISPFSSTYYLHSQNEEMESQRACPRPRLQEHILISWTAALAGRSGESRCLGSRRKQHPAPTGASPGPLFPPSQNTTQGDPGATVPRQWGAWWEGPVADPASPELLQPIRWQVLHILWLERLLNTALLVVQFLTAVPLQACLAPMLRPCSRTCCGASPSPVWGRSWAWDKCAIWKSTAWSIISHEGWPPWQWAEMLMFYL